MSRVLATLLSRHHAPLVVFGLVLATGFIQFLVVNPRAFLNVYTLPVVLCAYRFGVRRGVQAALLSCALVLAVALGDPRAFGGSGDASWARWFDLGTWGCFLLLLAFVVGQVCEDKEAQVRDLQDAYRGILEILPRLIDAVDQNTENHSRRVAEYSVEIARAMGLSESHVEDIRVGAFLHDIGKIDVNAEVLRKAASLSPEEMLEVQRHVDRGEELVGSMGGILRHAIPMVAFHHERWDGMGYKGLAGEDIPVGARIIAVADTFDAIVSDRPYRRGRTWSEAMRVIRDGSGTQFDPRVVDVFLELYEQDERQMREAA